MDDRLPRLEDLPGFRNRPIQVTEKVLSGTLLNPYREGQMAWLERAMEDVGIHKDKLQVIARYIWDGTSEYSLATMTLEVDVEAHSGWYVA